MSPAAANSRTVAIIGGGFTGLTAAYRLAQAGNVEVTVFERGQELGGLAGDFQLQGGQLERTYHHLFRTDADVLNLVKELGLQSELMWCDSSLGIYFGGLTYPFMSPMDLLRFKPCGLLSRLRLGLVVFYLQKRKDGRALADQSAYEWMRRACGEQVMRVVWGPLLRGKFDRYAEKISMAWLWARIHTRANSRERAASEKLGYFRGGFAVITRKLENELHKAGVYVQKGATVESLASDGGRPLLRVNGEVRGFDRCIFTGPSPVLAQLLPDDPAYAAYRRQLESIEYLGAVCLVFASDQYLGDVYWLNVNEPGAPFLVFINHTHMISREFYNGKHVYYIGSYQPHDSRLFKMPEAELEALWLGYLKKIHPDFDASRIVERHLFKLKYAQHIVDAGYESRIPPYEAPLSGLYLANFSQVYPEDRGTNFAVREGNRIAALVLDGFIGQS